MIGHCGGPSQTGSYFILCCKKLQEAAANDSLTSALNSLQEWPGGRPPAWLINQELSLAPASTATPGPGLEIVGAGDPPAPVMVVVPPVDFRPHPMPTSFVATTSGASRASPPPLGSSLDGWLSGFSHVGGRGGTTLSPAVFTAAATEQPSLKLTAAASPLMVTAAVATDPHSEPPVGGSAQSDSAYSPLPALSARRPITPGSRGEGGTSALEELDKLVRPRQLKGRNRGI